MLVSEIQSLAITARMAAIVGFEYVRPVVCRG
jgi:hypothetical protein